MHRKQKQMRLKKKDLLGLEGLSAPEITLILDTAKAMKEQALCRPSLSGKTVLNLFYEASTRTRTSFELAGKRLGADVVNFNFSASSMSKGETLKDTVLTLQAMSPQLIVVRHSAPGVAKLIADIVPASVINAGDGSHEHPSQALLDIFTMREQRGTVEGLEVAIVGDIAHSRVARSNIWGLTTLGARVRVAGPLTMIPPEVEKLGVQVFFDLEKALAGVDVIICLRIQLERQNQLLFPSVREYARFFGINPSRLRHAKKNAMIMHPGPLNRGVEVTSDLADGNRSYILTQVTNGVAVRMALFHLLAGEDHAAAH